MSQDFIQTKYPHIYPLFHSLRDELIHSYDRSHPVSTSSSRDKLDNFFIDFYELTEISNSKQYTLDVLDYLKEHFYYDKNYNMIYAVFAQTIAKSIPNDTSWSLLNIEDWGFDKNIIKEGIKDLLSFNFLVDEENINPNQKLFSIALLLLTNVNNAQRRHYLPPEKWKSLFNEEESLDIASVMFKYHPSIILSNYNFCNFQNFEDTDRFDNFFSKVWNITNNTLEDLILRSPFTPFFHMNSLTDSDMYDKILHSCLKPENLSRLKELDFILKQDEEFFYESNQSFSLQENESFNPQDCIDNNRTLHRKFFKHYVHEDIFLNDQLKKSLFVSSALHEIELCKILAKHSVQKVDAKHKRVKV